MIGVDTLANGRLFLTGKPGSLRCSWRIGKAGLPGEKSGRAGLRGQGYHAHVGR